MLPKYPSASVLRFSSGVLVSVLFIGLCVAAQAQSPDAPAVDLVRRTVVHELEAANAGGHYMYRFCKQSPQGSKTQDMIETREWLIGRLILKDGQPLTAAQRQQEDDRLQGLLTDHARLVKLQSNERDDEAHVRRMIKALPDAFLYESAGMENGDTGRELARVTFRPNPDFTPQTRELRVLQGMEGTMLIDPVPERLVRVEARLFRDIDFGWGFLGRIHRGGSFVLDQHGVGPDRWAITRLAIHYSAKLLLFINKRVDAVSDASDFRRMPDNLTLQQGLELLLKQDGMAISTQKAEGMLLLNERELR